MPRFSPALLAFEDFCALQLVQVRQKLDQSTSRALGRLGAAKKAHLQALCDYDLEQQPFPLTSAMGPKARTLAQVERDEC